MADETKPVDIPQEEAPVTATEAPVAAVDAPATEVKEETAVPAATEAAAESTETPAVAETTTETAAAPVQEEAKKEAEPVEDGQLEHKGSNFPKNFIYSKKFFWFGSEAVDPKKVPSLLKDHHLAAWASETGKGLLFYAEKGTDKASPSGAILLADAAEPTTDGTNKFVLSSKGHKHTFKAANQADRDNWVAQIKLKITEAKELSGTVTESEKYKATIASFTPAKKEEKVEEKKAEKAEEAPKAVEETPAAEASTETPVVAAAAATETPKEEAKEEAKDTKADERKRSASRKRTSIFGALLGGNKEKKEKAEETPKAVEEETPVAEAAAETPAEATEVPAAETTTEAPAEPEVAAAAEPAAAVEPETKAKEVKPAEKPTPTKRSSIFGGLPFGRKKTEEAIPTAPAKDIPEVAETAPVIPQPETTEPLSAEVSSPANVPVETTNVEAATEAPVTTPTAVNGEKKDVKADKRKSSFPFAFGKKAESGAVSPDAEATSPDGEKKGNAFSKFRATIKGKGKADKAAEKPEETATEAPKIEEEAATAEEAAPVEEAKPAEEVAAAPAAEETTEVAKDTPVASTPVVTATA